MRAQPFGSRVAAPRAVLALFALASAGLFVAPAAAGSIAPSHLRTLTNPYSGGSFTSFWTFAPIKACTTAAGSSGNHFSPGPHFSLKKGRGFVTQQSVSVPCANWHSVILSAHSVAGMHGRSFSAVQSAPHRPFTFSWSLGYRLGVWSTWAGGANGTYAYAEVGTEAWLCDLTSGGPCDKATGASNSSFLRDTNGTYYATLRLASTVHLTARVIAGDSYEFWTYSMAVTYAYVLGPRSAIDDAGAYIGLTNTTGDAVLRSITY